MKHRASISMITVIAEVQRKHVNELCNDRRAVTAPTALILARVFGNSPDFWLNVQRRSDIWEAMNSPRERRAMSARLSIGFVDFAAASFDSIAFIELWLDRFWCETRAVTPRSCRGAMIGIRLAETRHSLRNSFVVGGD